MPLYEVVILEKPTKKAKEAGALEKLVYGPKPVIAKSDQAAIFRVIKNGKPKFDIDRAEVIVRPFGEA
jgi:hypothetical protein